MKTVQLSGSLRTNVGKKGTKAVRNSGSVPCVLYGQGEQICFLVRSVDIEKLIYNSNVYQIDLDIDGTKKRAIIQDKQMHPLTDLPVHVDFLELSDEKQVKMNIPVRAIGRSRGVMSGGLLVTNFRTLKVKGFPNDLPDFIEVDVTPLRIGQAIRVRDVKLPGLQILDAESAVIVSVKMTRGAVKDSEEDEAAADAETAE